MGKRDEQPNRSTQFRADVGRRLRQAREHAGLTQEDVTITLKSGFSKSALYRWENGKEMPGLEKAAQLAALYRVALDWIVGRTTCTDLLARGHMLIDGAATRTIEHMAKNGGCLEDVPDRWIRGPGIQYAWRVPDELVILPADMAASVDRAMRAYMEQLRAHTRARAKRLRS